MKPGYCTEEEPRGNDCEGGKQRFRPLSRQLGPSCLYLIPSECLGVWRLLPSNLTPGQVASRVYSTPGPLYRSPAASGFNAAL